MDSTSEQIVRDTKVRAQHPARSRGIDGIIANILGDATKLAQSELSLAKLHFRQIIHEASNRLLINLIAVLLGVMGLAFISLGLSDWFAHLDLVRVAAAKMAIGTVWCSATATLVWKTRKKKKTKATS